MFAAPHADVAQTMKLREAIKEYEKADSRGIIQLDTYGGAHRLSGNLYLKQGQSICFGNIYQLHTVFNQLQLPWLITNRSKMQIIYMYLCLHR
jgi:hypothetical protein